MLNIFQLNHARAKLRHRRLAEAKNDLLVCLLCYKLARLVSRLTSLAHLPKLRSKLPTYPDRRSDNGNVY